MTLLTTLLDINITAPKNITDTAHLRGMGGGGEGGRQYVTFLHATYSSVVGFSKIYNM